MTDACPQVLILNGGSSSGKTTLARSLQDLLDGYWLRLGVDTLVDAAPGKLLGVDGLDLREDGSVVVGTHFVEVERQWMAGIAAMAAAGAHILVEDNFVSGPCAQHRWRDALRAVTVGWVAVRCAPEIAAARESARGDRVAGMAARQAESVHREIGYDLEVDTGVADPDELAALVRQHFCAAG
jgi:chloramphenicol 3-O phosphotransferase